MRWPSPRWLGAASYTERSVMDWLGTVLTAVGSSVITCVFMEAYYKRKAQNEMGDYDPDMEGPAHKAG